MGALFIIVLCMVVYALVYTNYKKRGVIIVTKYGKEVKGVFMSKEEAYSWLTSSLHMPSTLIDKNFEFKYVEV